MSLYMDKLELTLHHQIHLQFLMYFLTRKVYCYLKPQLTNVQRDAIVSPANGLLIYNTDSNEFEYNIGTTTIPVWQRVTNTSAGTNIGDSIKYSNTDIATNINADPAINAPLLGTLNRNDDLTLYSVSTTTNQITVNQAGRYRVIVNIPLSTAGTRARLAPEMRITVNGTGAGTYSSTGYIRANNGHQDASLHITEILELTAGQIIAVTVSRSANDSNVAANNVTIRAAGAANIYIEKIR